MNKKQISHEVPIPLLQTALQFNDYDYSLTHLLHINKQYYDFYKQNSSSRIQIMDNSIFEGIPLSWDAYAHYIKDIKPTYYIVPDTIGNKDKTLEDFKLFRSQYDLPGKVMAVVQGQTYEELLECFEFYLNEGVDKIAIVFHSNAYLNEHDEINVARMFGRVKLMNMIVDRFGGIIDTTNTKIHLLGASLPQEFYNYKREKFDCIESIDTSNPILVGLNNESYYCDNGYYYLLDKPKETMMTTYENTLPTVEVMENINNNIKSFKEIVNG